MTPEEAADTADPQVDDDSLHDNSLNYDSLDTDSQVALLRPVAESGARAFGIDPVSVDLVLHGFNSTFRVDGAGGVTVAVRVHTNSFSTPAHIHAHTAWMRDLARDTSIRLPVPLLTPEGESVTEVDGRLVTAATWLEGDDVDTLDRAQGRELGRIMARLHEHARGWAIPEGGSLTTYDDPLLGDENRLTRAYADRPEDRALIEWAFDRCSAAMTAAAEAEPAIVIHADLHGGNLKWHEGEMSVFDFDDCGLGARAFDLAISTFYRRGGDAAVEEAVRQGYSEVLDLPELPDEVFEGMVASRQLLLANDLLRSSNTELREMAIEYLDRTVQRLQRWWDTGRFTL